MSNKPNRPIAECIADFNDAVASNDFDKLPLIERELDIVVKKRLRRLSYEGYPIKQMDALLSALPVDYNTATMDRVLRILDEKTPAERMAELG